MFNQSLVSSCCFYIKYYISMFLSSQKHWKYIKISMENNYRASNYVLAFTVLRVKMKNKKNLMIFVDFQ